MGAAIVIEASTYNDYTLFQLIFILGKFKIKIVIFVDLNVDICYFNKINLIFL